MSSSPHTDRLKALAAKRRAAGASPKPADPASSGGSAAGDGGDLEALPSPQDVSTKEALRAAKVGKTKAAVQSWRRLAITFGAVGVVVGVLAVAYYVVVILPGARAAREQARKSAEEATRLVEAKRAAEEEAQRLKEEKALADAARGSFMISSVPEGATVGIGSEDSKVTPAKFERVKAGTYPVNVNLDGYDPVLLEVTITQDGFTNLPTVHLRRSMGSIAVGSDPPGAQVKVLLNGKVLREGTTPTEFSEVETGTYELELVRGDARIRETVVVNSKQRAEFAPAFRFGTVSLRSEPPGAVVTKGGRTIGSTPITMAEVPVGHLTLELRKHRFFPTNVALLVQEGQQTSAVVRMTDNPGPSPGRRFRNSFGLEMIWIPGGYWAGQTEVSQATYHKVTGGNPSVSTGASRPVDSVTWHDAIAFCEQLNQSEDAIDMLPRGFRYTLPSNQQWSTLNAGMPASAPTGSSKMLATRPVGKGSANRLGLYDTRGNVWEWCLDWFDSAQERKVVRGGGIAPIYEGTDPQVDLAGWSPKRADNKIGFRVVLVPAR